MFGLMNGKTLLKRHFDSEAQAAAWAQMNSKGRGGYKVVVLDTSGSAPPDVTPLIEKWVADVKKAISETDIAGYQQGLVDAARICEQMGANDGVSETLLAIYRDIKKT